MEWRKVEELVQLVRANLTDDLLKPEQRERVRRTSSAGHCYIASEVIWHLTGKQLSVYRIVHEGNSHWFLMDPESWTVVDATADQFLTAPPYGLAVRAAFRTRELSRRARVLAERVEQSRLEAP